MDIDHVDRALLELVQRDSSGTLQELARVVNLSAPGVQKRLQKLEEAGVILGQKAMVRREALGYDLLCFVQVNLRHHDLNQVRAFHEAIKLMPQVLECHHITGAADYLLKILARNRSDLEHFLIEFLTPAPGVDRIHTSLVLSEIKETTEVPVHSEERYLEK
jgi:Lrp/AsnC family transcriptional regulator, leucine-responsive regulatory protein